MTNRQSNTDQLQHDDKALVERLRSGKWLGETTCGPAADRIEAQAAAALRAMEEALIWADLKIRGFPNTDQSDVEFIRAALRTARETNDEVI